jgi:hypothetical protein
MGSRSDSLIVQYELDVAIHHRVIDRHAGVQVPALDDPRIDHGKVDLPEPFEVWGISSQHVHDHASLILDPSQRKNRHTVDH